MGIKVSVVVPTYKRADLLERCLVALANQDFDPQEYEVIVVDNAGCEATSGLVESFTRIENLHYVSASWKRGPAAARNAGWKTARGEVIAFTDDDCIPTFDWLQQGMAAFVDGISGVSGQVVVPLPAAPTDYEIDAAQLSVSRFITANSFYRREALEKTGGFDERYQIAWREDTDLFFSLSQRSIKLSDAPNAVVNHPIRPASWGISLAQQRRSMYNALLFKKYPELYRRHIQSKPPMLYYSILLSAVLGIVSAAVRQWIPAALFTALWIFQIGAFTYKRLKNTRRSLDHVLEMLLTSILIPPLSIFWRLYGAVKYRVLFF